MRVVVLAAADRTGGGVVQAAPSAGHDSAAFVRSEDKGDWASVDVVESDATDQAEVDRVTARHEAILCTVGGKSPFLPTTVEKSIAKTVIASMGRLGREIGSAYESGTSDRFVEHGRRRQVSAAERPAYGIRRSARGARRRSGG